MKKILFLMIIGACAWGFLTHTRQAPEGGHAGSSGDVISNGERVTLTDHIEPGKTTVFLFYADW